MGAVTPAWFGRAHKRPEIFLREYDRDPRLARDLTPETLASIRKQVVPGDTDKPRWIRKAEEFLWLPASILGAGLLIGLGAAAGGIGRSTVRRRRFWDPRTWRTR